MIIGIDCSSKGGSLALNDGFFSPLEFVEDIPQKLEDLKIEASDIEKILITEGPGSFASLRVGFGVAEGIALPWDIPIFGYSTFLAMVEGAPCGNLFPILPARRKVVYAAHFKRTERALLKIFTNKVLKIEDLVDYLRTEDTEPIIFGRGADVNEKLIQEEGYSIHSSPPIAPQLINLYRKKAPHTLNPKVPFYLAPSEAIRKREEAIIHIRRMGIKDIKEILEIEQDVFPVPWDADAFYLTIIKRDCFSIVGMIEGKVVGYLIGCPEGCKFHLMNLAIARVHWRKGFGRKMITYLLKELEKTKEIKTCYLEVRIHNNAAFELYKSLGFRMVGIKTGYYENGEDAVIMEIGV